LTMIIVAGVILSLLLATVGAQHCSWVEGKLNVVWNPIEEEATDYYELQVANQHGGEPFAVYSSEKTQVQLDFLVAGTTYYFKVRSHRAGMPSLGPGTWRKTGTEFQCATGMTPRTKASPMAHGNTMLLEVMRQSEYTYDVDYLMNHNSGDLDGDTSFIVSSSQDPDQPGFLNVTFPKSVFSLYCLEVLQVIIPDTVTTNGDDRFADYLSCNDNGNATDPLCGCDNFIDRSLSKAKDQAKFCHNSSGGPCTHAFHDCKCSCTDASLKASANYVGMMPVYCGQSELLGYWYSTPKDAECQETEIVGTVRADGTSCTWKRYPEARVVRGGDALDFGGWNVSSGGGFGMLDAAQVRQNAQVLRNLFDSQPYQKWSCSEATAEMVI